MRYTVTCRTRPIHALEDYMILFCRAEDREAAAKRFCEIFKTKAEWLTITKGWDFDNGEAKRLFTREAMNQLQKDFRPGGVYQEMFGRLQGDFNAYPHYGFEYAEVRKEKESQDQLKEKVCTAESPAPKRDGRGWEYLRSWNTKYCHSEATNEPFEDTDALLYSCPHCKCSWIYESNEVFAERRKRSLEMQEMFERMKDLKF